MTSFKSQTCATSGEQIVNYCSKLLLTTCRYYRSADKSLARPTSRCILFDGENISFDASLVLSGFGGEEVAFSTQVRGFKPGRTVGCLKGDKKILCMPSFGREVKLSVPCRRFAACKRTLGAYPRHHLATISRP